MEKFILEQDIPVFYVEASSFPEGILAAFKKLYALLPDLNGRRFFGISYPDRSGRIIYKAAVAENAPGEASQYGCPVFTIHKGEYMSELLKSQEGNGRLIGEIFQQLLAHPDLDKNGYCLEMYLEDTTVRCMVPLLPKNS
ncbi:hypothetical protein [Chitinophaga sp. HK235]|uniref:hypothetical protein n=1 Tax=Chitinophaga sp. HK235 TaxID=2952571 RepID=UPI001BAB73EA|nr:hypothetical protein [Chitinophaga sp. HK235]